jgi:hypothetical protein
MGRVIDRMSYNLGVGEMQTVGGGDTIPFSRVSWRRAGSSATTSDAAKRDRLVFANFFLRRALERSAPPDILPPCRIPLKRLLMM